MVMKKKVVFVATLPPNYACCVCCVYLLFVVLALDFFFLALCQCLCLVVPCPDHLAFRAIERVEVGAIHEDFAPVPLFDPVGLFVNHHHFTRWRGGDFGFGFH